MTIPVPNKYCKCVITVMPELDGDKAVDYIKGMKTDYLHTIYMTRDYYIFEFTVVPDRQDLRDELQGLIDLVMTFPDYESPEYDADSDDEENDFYVSQSYSVRFMDFVDTETGNPVGEAYYMEVVPQGDYYKTHSINDFIKFRDNYFSDKVINYDFMDSKENRICRTCDPLRAETLKRAFSDCPIWYEFWITDNIVRLKGRYTDIV